MMDALAHGDGQPDVSQGGVRAAVPLAELLLSRCPDRMWGGPSSGGADCAICAQVVPPGELEFEMEFDREGGASEPDRYRIHVRCLAAAPRPGAPEEGSAPC